MISLLAALSLFFAVAHVSLGSSVTSVLATNSLLTRQLSTPTLPDGQGFGTCSGPCNTWEGSLSVCSADTASSDPLACYCTQAYISQMAACYDCLVPLATQAGESNFQAEAQTALNDLEDACAEGGDAVASQSIAANSAPAAQTVAGSASAGASAASTTSPAETTVPGLSGSSGTTLRNGAEAPISLSWTAAATVFGGAGILFAL